jgi:hypothetical protein
MDKVPEPSNSECCTPSSEPIRIYMAVFCHLLTILYIRKTKVSTPVLDTNLSQFRPPPTSPGHLPRLFFKAILKCSIRYFTRPTSNKFSEKYLSTYENHLMMMASMGRNMLRIDKQNIFVRVTAPPPFVFVSTTNRMQHHRICPLRVPPFELSIASSIIPT